MTLRKIGLLFAFLIMVATTATKAQSDDSFEFTFTWPSTTPSPITTEGPLCTTPFVQNGRVRVLGTTNLAPASVPVDSQVMLACQSGYAVSNGPKVAICNPGGVWSNSLGQCLAIGVRSKTTPSAAVTCVVPRIEHGRITSYGIISFRSAEVNVVPQGAMVALMCDAGFRISAGSQTSVCTIDGRWSQNLGRCVPSEIHNAVPPLQDPLPVPVRPRETTTRMPETTVERDTFPPMTTVTNFYSKECGKKSPGIKGRGYKIYGGTPAVYPWMARIEVSYLDDLTGSQTFGGSLISNKWVLTTANRLVGRQIAKTSVLLGGKYRRNPNTAQAIEAMISSIVVHPRFDEARSHNFALIELNTNLTLNENIQPICLPDYPDTLCDPLHYPRSVSHVDSCDQVTAAGWGLTEDSDTFPNELRQVDLDMWSFDACREAALDLSDAEFCTGGDAGKDTCTGDSGGPAMCLKNNRYYLLGITPSSMSQPCGVPGVPKVYGRVCSILPWIHNVIDNV